MSAHTVITRAIKLTPDTLDVIFGQGMKFDMGPQIDEMMDAANLEAEYYFVTNHPGVTPDKPISWVLVPDFMFNDRFQFATKESKTQLISLLDKRNRVKS